jgi:hypothetical protein
MLQDVNGYDKCCTSGVSYHLNGLTWSGGGVLATELNRAILLDTSVTRFGLEQEEVVN